MSKHRSSTIPALLVALCAATACSDSSPVAPNTPPPSSPLLGVVQGTVNGRVMTATYTPLSASYASAPSLSPATYGTQNVNVIVTGTLDSMVTVVNTRRSWYFRVRIQNLETWPIGSNYGQAAAPDTSGVFVFFTSPPLVSIPAGCACTVSVNGQSGTRSFTAPNQKYFWYRSRPSAYAGVTPGNDTTTNNPEWEFKTTYSPPDTAHAFFFSVMLSTAWSAAHESSWSTLYDGTQDTLPDANGKPRWRKFASTGHNTLGGETFTAGTELSMTASTASTSIFMARHDTLGLGSAVMDVTARVTTVSANTVQAVFGFVEATGSPKQVFVGIANNQVGFVNFANGSGNWTFPALPLPFALDGTAYHTYRLRKIGTTSVALCVDNVQRLTLAHSSLQNVRANLNTSTAVFGLDGNGGGASAGWKSVAYTIGSDGGGC